MGRTIETRHSGVSLLNNPLLNKGTAFSENEREEFQLLGLLPPHVDTIEEQLQRAYEAYSAHDNDLQRHIFLRQLQDENEVLFYRLLHEHIEEMMPIVYTPVVGQACSSFSHIYRRHRGLFISFPRRDRILEMLDNSPVQDPAIIVVTDGERILGLGDQGAGGMGIPIGKLSLYSLCGGMDPARTLPIVLDVGTNNEQRLQDPEYIGWRHERVVGQEYDDFVEMFVAAVTKKWPNVMLQFEDFANQNARRLLDKYRNRLCTFNDDIQGTAAVALAGVLSAANASKVDFTKQQILMFGSGSAGLGIADLIAEAMVERGLSEEEAAERIWLFDKPGLLHDGFTDLQPAQQRFAKSWETLKAQFELSDQHIDLPEAVRLAKATVIIGTSARSGAFTEPVVRAMAANCDRPIIFPLSNPTSNSEAIPSDVLAWTEGKALIGTGSPFDPVQFGGKAIPIGQCNNSYIFPGLGLGVVASGATRVTPAMFMAAADTLAKRSPAIADAHASLFPPLTSIREVSLQIAIAVARAAMKEGHAEQISDSKLGDVTRECIWTPEYSVLKSNVAVAVG